jgi:hypothetical protein
MPVTGAALSPDGKMLALSLMHEFPPGSLYGSVEVITMASGATRTWSGQSAPGYWPGTPSWAGDGTLVVPWWHSASQGTIPAELTGIRQLDAAAPGVGTAGCLPRLLHARVLGTQTKPFHAILNLSFCAQREGCVSSREDRDAFDRSVHRDRASARQ